MAVATAIALGGMAITAASTANSFIQAGKQKQKQREAEASAEAAMAEARKKLGINFTDEMAVKKEPYELQREALLSAGAQAIEAGVESDRGAAATAGRVLMAQNEAQAGVRTAMGVEMTDIEKQQIAEQSRLRDLNVQLDLGQVEGAQEAARDASESRAAQMAQGFQGVSSFASQGLNLLPLYFKDGKDKFDLSKATTSGTNVNGANPAFQSLASERFPVPNTGVSYGPGGINYAPTSNYSAMSIPKSNPFGPQMPNAGTQYGMFGLNYSGVGGN